MRASVLAVLVVLTLALAGCTQAPSTSTTTTSTTATPTGTTATTTTTTPSSTTTTTPPPSTTTAPTVPTTNNSTTTPPPVTQYVNLTHDFSTADVNATMTLGANATWRNLTVDIHAAPTLAGTYACVGSLHITIYEPDGTQWADFIGGQNANAQSERTVCGTASVANPAAGAPIVPGVWHVQFTGPGTGIAIVSART